MRVLLAVGEGFVHERLGVMSIGATLRRAGVEVRLVLAGREGLAGMRRILEEFRPAVIGYSVMTGEHQGLLALNLQLRREFDYLAVFGGPHPTFYPRMIDAAGVDAICRGEGDLAFCELCERHAAGGDWESTPGFWTKRDGRIRENPLGRLIEDLDALPFPDRELMYTADPQVRQEGHKIFFTGRGCPYRCSYCFNVCYNSLVAGLGKTMRVRSPENVVAEIAEVKRRYPLDVVWIDDDVFLLKPPGWLDAFSLLYHREIGLPFSCNMRAETVEEEPIRRLRAAGLDSAWMGIETGNEEVANRVLHRNLTNAQIRAAVSVLKRHGVKVVTQNIVGLPVPNSFEVDLETLDLNLSLQPTYAWSSILYPYPGTPIAEYAAEHGFLDRDALFLETNKRASMLTFSSKRQQRRTQNLHKLFGIVVRFPFLRPYVGTLVELPADQLYTGLYYLLYGWVVKMELYPMKDVRREVGSYLKLWWRSMRKG